MANITTLGQKNSVLSSPTGLGTLGKMNASNVYARAQAAKEAEAKRAQELAEQNSGGFFGGLGYLGEKIGLGFLSGIEGIWDYTAGGIAKLFGADDWAEQQFASDWVNYNHADEWFNPSSSWQVAGDVAGGIGTSLPALAGAAAGAAIIYFSGGSLSGVGAKLIISSISAGIAGFGAAGNATKEAYRETGQLTGKEFGYGALSGITEAGIEFATAGIGKGTGRIISSLGKTAAKETAETVAKTGVKTIFKQIGEDFVTEAFEEGLAEFLSPVYQRMTYNPDAENASAQEIFYAAMVGGLSGMVMSGSSIGINAGVNTTVNYFSGKKAAESGTYAGVIEAGRALADAEGKNDTNIEAFQSAQDTYNKLTESLKKNNGIATTEELLERVKAGNVTFKAKDLMYLGKLKRTSVIAHLHPYIERSARGLVFNAENAAQRYAAFGMTDANGKPIRVTAEQILSGIDASLVEKAKAGTLTDAEAKTFAKSLRKALSENSTLATLAVAEATGGIMMDTRRMAEAMLNGENLANTADLNRLIEKGKPEEMQALGQALGIEDWSKVTIDELRTRVAEFNANGGISEFAEQSKRMRRALEQGAESAKPLPHLLRKNMQDGVYRYTSEDGSVNMAIFKEGDTYRLYDYDGGNISRALSVQDVNQVLKRFWTSGQTTTAKSMQFTEETNLARETTEIDAYAAENIPDYNSLSEPNKAAIRMTVRQARAHGLADAETLVFAKVAAKSGLNVIFDAERAFGDGAISGNTIYVNPNNSEARTYEVILGHEMFHKLFADGDKRALQLFREARDLLERSNPEKAQEVRERYKKFYKKLGTDSSVAQAISEEEVAAAGAEEVFRSADAWAYILSKEPSFADKVLSFFRKSAREYSSVQGLSAQARKFVRQYKALFESLAERNQGNNALSIALEGAGAKKMPVTNTETDYMHVTGDNDEEAPIVTNTDVDTDTRFALSKGKAERLKNDLVKLGTLGIRLDAGGKSIRILTDKFTQNKNIFSNKGRNMREVNARIKAIPHFAEILRSCTYEGSNTEIHGLENEAKKGVVAMHRFKGSYDGFDIEVVVRDKGSKQFLYEIKFIEKEKSPQQSMTDESASPAPLGDAENKLIITHSEKKSNTPGENSSKKPQKKRFALTDEAYLAAVESGDMDTVQAMVDEAAKKAGYTVKGYHGSHNSFTVFDEGKSGLYGGIESKIGFWFGATRKGAENWVSETWGTDENNPQVYESWLKIENPKVFTTTEMDSEAIKKVDEEIADAEEKYKSLYEELNELGLLARWSVSEYIRTNGKTAPKNSQNVDEKTFLEAQKIADELVSCKVMIESLRAKRGDLIFTDSYEQFKTEIYKLAGKTAEDANVGGLGMRLENGADVVKKYKESLVSQGYDGIIIKDTRFDADTIGEGKKSVQIVAFHSEQIKSADPITYDDAGKIIPLSKRFSPYSRDIRFALPETDSEGNPLSPEQREFFAESQIRAVEKDGYAEISPEGSLLPVYHGTNSGEFYEFDKKLIGAANDAGWYGRGFYFAFSEYEAGTYGRRVLKCYLNIKNPFNFSEEMGQYDGVADGDIYFDFASFVINMARKFPEIAKTLTVDVVEGFDGEGNAESSQSKNFIELADEIESIYNSERLTVESIYEGDTEYFGYKVSDNVEALDIPSEIKKIIKDEYITSASWASYLLKDGTITQEQYDSILDAMEEYGEHNFESYYPRGRFKTREQAEKYRLSAAITYLSDKRYSYIEQHLPEYFMQRAGKQFNEELRRRGYDGVIQSTTGDEIVAFEANQIKLASNKTPSASPDIRYALPESDSTGAELTSDQRKYFDASKQLDSEGRLQVMYQGAPEEFFTFDKKKSKASNLYGRGFYFTNSADQARHYGTVRGYYLNITNPLSATKKTISRMQMRKFLNAVAENEDYSIENYGTYDVAEVLRSVYEGKSDFAMLYDVSLTAIGDLVEAVELFNKVNGTEYDGFILDTESVIFRSEQAKLTSNTAPSSNPDTRYALTGDEDLDAIFGDIDMNADADGASFDIEAVLERGIPRKPGASTLTIGEMKKTIANNTHYQVFSKGKALEVIGRMFGTSDLTAKTRAELADALWQGFNDCTDLESRQTFAHDMAEFIVATMVTEAKVENPDVMEAQERLSYLSTYIGKISFHPEYLSEIRHIADKAGLKKILGRWGYKGKKGTSRVPMDVFAVDIAREMPGMSELEDMHPVEAFMELDAMYERAREDVKDKWISAYWEATDADMLAIVSGIEADIMRAFETEGEQSKFSRLVEGRIEYYSTRAEFWKAEHDRIKGRDRILGLLMSQAQKMKDLRLGTFANATQFDSELFKNSIEKLAKIQFRGNLNVSGTRKIMGELLQWYRKDNPLLEFVDDKNPGLYVQSVADMLESLSEGKKGFSKEELLTMYDVMSYFVKFVENYGKVFRNGKMIEALPEAKRYIGIAQANEGLKVGLFAKLSGSWYAEMFSDPATLVRRMDYYERGFYTEMFEDLREAATDAEIAEMRIMREYDEFLRSNKKYIEKASEELIEYRGQKIPKIQLIDLYMTMKRKHAWAGIAINGFPFKNLEGKVVRVPGFLPDEHISETDLEAAITAQQAEIAKHFTDADRQYMAILEKGYNEDARKLKADRDMQRLGFTNASTDYYYPIRRAYTAQNIDTSDAQAEYDRVTNSSFNKDIVKGAKQEIAIESADARFRRHIHAVCQYAYLSPAIETFNRLYNMDTSGNRNHPISVRTASENVWAKGNKYFMKLISDIQGIPAGSSEGMAALGLIRGNYAKFQLGANPKVWFTQLSSIFASSSILDADSITRGVFLSSEGIDQYCPLAELRRYENTAAMAQGVLDKQGKARSKAGRAIQKVGKFSDVLMQPIGMMDRFVVCRVFGACQVQVEKNGGAKVGTEANKIEAGKLLRKVIQETQQNSIATERSAAMRSSNEILRTVTMFTSDSMKVIGRVIDAFGEISVLHSKIKAATDPDVKAELRARLKVAKRNARKATTALVLTAVFMAGIAQLFRWLYDKEQKEDETVAQTMLVDAIGNLFGGLPIFKDIYATFAEGYDIDNYAYSAVNDLISGVKSIVDLVGLICENKATQQDYASRIKKVSYAVGQITGLPVRNVYNVLYGLTKRFNPEAAYKIDNVFYEKNYKNDFYKAIENEDVEMASFILSLLYNERMGVDMSEAVHNELYSLSAKGYKVLPKSAPKSITVEGAEYELSEAQQAAVRGSYSASQASLEKLFTKEKYKKLSEEMKAEAVNYVYELHYNMALEDALGIDRGNAVLISSVIGAENLAMLHVATKGLTSDTDKLGNAISGSKRKKVVAAINQLDVSSEQKLLLICAKGYALKDGDLRGLSAERAKKLLLRYILRMGKLNKQQKAELAALCGFEVRNGRIMLKTPS